MKTDFDKELEKMKTDEKEMPVKVRQSLDSTYEMIRTRAKKKKNNFIWKRVAAAACTLLITGALLSNEQVRAGVTEFFNIGDKGVDIAISEGFIQENDSSATDQEITVKLERHFLDANKLGMSFQLDFGNLAMIDSDVTDISMDYRLKNGDGEYIFEHIPDTKPLKGAKTYVTSGAEHSTITDLKTGKVQYDVIVESHQDIIPVLKDATIEVESINIFTVNGLKKVDGRWDLAITDQDKNNANTTIEYTMANQSSILQVSAATANPTSFNLTFSLNKVFENESPFVDAMKVIDEDGNEHRADSFSMETKDAETIISSNFPITSYDQFDKLMFVIDDIVAVELLRE